MPPDTCPTCQVRLLRPFGMCPQCGTIYRSAPRPGPWCLSVLEPWSLGHLLRQWRARRNARRTREHLEREQRS